MTLFLLCWIDFLVVRIGLLYFGACFLYSLVFFYRSQRSTVSYQKEERRKINRVYRQQFSNFTKRWLQMTSMYSYCGYIYLCSLIKKSFCWHDVQPYEIFCEIIVAFLCLVNISKKVGRKGKDGSILLFIKPHWYESHC